MRRLTARQLISVTAHGMYQLGKNPEFLADIGEVHVDAAVIARERSGQRFFGQVFLAYDVAGAGCEYGNMLNSALVSSNARPWHSAFRLPGHKMRGPTFNGPLPD